VHGAELGFVAYLQMSTRVENYARYVLANLIDSWDRPYFGNVIPDPAISCLSDSLARDLHETDCNQLRDEELPDADLDLLVNRSADRLLGIRKYSKLSIDLVRALLYLQRRDPPRRARVLKFLRCEAFTPYDRQLLGGVSSSDDEHAAARMLTDLGKLVAATGNGALVLLVDQLEDIYQLDDAPNRFRVAMDALRHISDHVPSSVIVIACLDDFYTHLRSALNKPMLDRLERDPEPVQLTASRSLEEIEELVAPRLLRLFEHQAVRIHEDQPLFPFSHADLEPLVNQRTRDVLEWFRTHHEASVRAGKISTPVAAPAPAPPVSVPTLELAQEWNDYWPTVEGPTEQPQMLQLIAWALQHADKELPEGRNIAVQAKDSYVDTRCGNEKFTVGLCDKSPMGGALGKQVDALRQRASSSQAIPVAVRSGEYPRPGKAQVSEKLKGLLQDGGRRVVITDTEWRRMHALQRFMSQRPGTPAMKAWLEQDRPLLNITAIREILNLDAVPDSVPPASPVPAAPAATSAVASPAGASPRKAASALPVGARAGEDSFQIGHTRALSPQPVTAQCRDFVTHAAFLGSTKSGKTTLALNIIEQLLAREVPVLMVDRKGDLCSYGEPAFWQTPIEDAGRSALRATLRERVDVRIYTPGEPRGRGLDLPVIPSGLKELPAHERGIVARSAASALGAMMGYGKSQADQTRLGILGKAIELVGQIPSAQPLGIPELVSLLDDEDPDLVSAIGKLDPKHFRALVENLETLRLRHDHLLRHDSQRLSPELFFGREPSGGLTPLSIISTKFIGDNAAVDFWVARLLGELSRWASRHPCQALQAVVFLDEADIYLPAQSKPATKEPMLDLLKRGRAAGLGVLLATQSPGDLDYRCRDNIRSWFVGRVAEKTAVDKMKPLLSESRINVAAKLALAKTGEFFRLEEGEVVEFKAGLSLMQTSQVPEETILRLARAPE
ncbi:MAG TPA: hypothetical protein VJU61_22660, partial [Polyangiaceae bacterium]|nr:hypothetical protein [Polyangiaceae bacterium]